MKRTAIITGASSGIGREFARQIKQRGEADHFLLIARRRERLEELAEELKEADILPLDLCEEESVRVYADYLKEHRLQVVYLVNGAGFGKFGDYAHISETDVSRMIDLNSKATVLITHATIPYMEKGGHIIEIGSGSCFTPLPHFNVYAASKAFVLHYAKGLRAEVKPLGISVTCFCPGWVETEFLENAQTTPGALYPKNPKPLLKAKRVVAYGLSRARRGKLLAVTNWYTKLQHMMFKLLPDRLLTWLWLKTVL
ncbi:MAG: SDR family NAD(P)-dependent oxidoreductase [Clostridia bacterium]|nr:SDR family NAD(P)-dependent oxidoreductase [Clostridia bacterium]